MTFETNLQYLIKNLTQSDDENTQSNHYAIFFNALKKQRDETIKILKQILSILDDEDNFVEDASFSFNINMLSMSPSLNIATFAQNNFSTLQHVIFLNDFRLTQNAIKETVKNIQGMIEDLDFPEETLKKCRQAITQANEATIILDRIERKFPILQSEYNRLRETNITELVAFLTKYDVTSFIKEGLPGKYSNTPKKPWEHLLLRPIKSM